MRADAALSFVLLAGCTSPVAYGRTADVQRPGYLRGGPRTNLAVAPTSATIRQDPNDPDSASGTPDGTYDDYVAGWRTPGPSSESDLAFGWIGSVQVEVAVGIFEPCELGMALGFAHGGAEVRCALLRGGEGELSLAPSVGVAHQGREPPGGVEWRGGVDASLRAGWVRPFLDVYLARAPAVRSVIVPGGPGPYPVEDPILVEVERDEWLLAVPIGIALPRASRTGEGRFIVAVQPEFMLDSTQRKPLEDPFVERISHRWAIYFTLGGEFAFAPRSDLPEPEPPAPPAEGSPAHDTGGDRFPGFGCKSDLECKADRICVDGACQWPPAMPPKPAK